MARNSSMKKVLRYAKAQSTVFNWLGVTPLKKFGFYIPYRYAFEVEPVKEYDLIPWLKQQFDQQSKEFLKWIEKAKIHNSFFEGIHVGDSTDVNRPRFDQDWFPGLDGAMAYTMVREFRPELIIEVGSGHSTRFLSQAIKDGGLNTHLHSIDPQPRREIDQICSKVSRYSVTDIPMVEFQKLKKNDILFIDCSHISMPGTDVDYLFTQVLPQLSSEVVVHIHDIFLPHGYPSEWEWRSYNEQNMLLAMLGAHGRYQVICPNHYLRKYHEEELSKLDIFLKEGAKEASFWLSIV